jgi:hypothetical protein
MQCPRINTMPTCHGEKIIVNVDEIRLMHWIQDATTIRFAKDHGVQIRETPNT